jgi:hypothetical protein
LGRRLNTLLQVITVQRGSAGGPTSGVDGGT